MQYLFLFAWLFLFLAGAIAVAVVALIYALSANRKAEALTKELNRLKGAPIPQPVTAPVAPRPIPPTQQKPTPQPVSAPPQKPVPPPVPEPARPRETRSWEQLLGKNLLAVAASALIFIGLVAFGVLAFAGISKTLKIFSMFFAGFALTGLGVFLTKKNRNVFTEILTGCGVGAIYISILVTHLYFESIGDVTAFALILVWGIGAYLLSRLLSSKSLVYIVHFGCILSTVLSAVYGQLTGKYIEIVLYQIVTFALLFFANRKFKILYLVSSYASVALNMILSLLLQGQIGSDLYGAATTGILALLFLALALFNTVICLRLLRSPTVPRNVNLPVTNLLYFFSLLLGGYPAAFDLIRHAVTELHLFGVVTETAGQWLTNGLSLLVTALLLAAVGVVCRQLIRDRETRDVCLISAESFFALLLLFSAIILEDIGKTLPLTLLFALANGLLARRAEKRGEAARAKTLKLSGAIFLLADMVLTGFFLPEFERTGILYSLLLIALSFWYSKLLWGSTRHFPTAQFLLTDLHLIFTACAFGDSVLGNYRFGLILATGVNILITLYYRYHVKTPSAKGQSVSEILSEWVHSLWIVILSALLAYDQSPLTSESFGLSDGFNLILAALLLILGLLELPQIIQSKNPALCVWYSVKFTFLILFPLGVFTTLLEEAFLLSLFTMVLAALCILFGFAKDLKATRIYGLVLVLASVIKMVTADVWNQTSLIRVVSLIVGGGICFAVSALYSHAEKRQSKKNAEESKTA